ncbi:unnamed protein product [Soboliphyme baturini]|uniref:Secreted protein n=1 Tax=Soboliphyme baturini TaxID=241478 RepID=A0A183IVM4_9BILA|nr:unnamed protein product [Soboliphyme baturini]
MLAAREHHFLASCSRLRIVIGGWIARCALIGIREREKDEVPTEGAETNAIQRTAGRISSSSSSGGSGGSGSINNSSDGDGKKTTLTMVCVNEASSRARGSRRRTIASSSASDDDAASA